MRFEIVWVRRIESCTGVFERLWKVLQGRYDELKGLDWSFVSVDGCMTKAPLGREKTGPNPTDRGKCGTKISLATDAAGVPLAVVVAGANRNDPKLLNETLANAERARPAYRPGEHGLCLDKGYDDPITVDLAKFYGYELHLRCRGEDVAQLPSGWKPRRWVVERSHSTAECIPDPVRIRTGQKILRRLRCRLRDEVDLNECNARGVVLAGRLSRVGPRWERDDKR